MDINAALNSYIKQTKEYRKCHFIPEFAGDDGMPAQLYSSAVTLLDDKKIGAFAQQNSSQETPGGFDLMVQTIIYKLELEDGSKPFNASMHDQISQLPTCFINRLYKEINTRPTIEDHKKNSQKTDASNLK